MNKKWKLFETAPHELAPSLDNLHPIVGRLLYNRGLRSAEQIDYFLHPDKELDPFLFADMQAAVELTVKHIKALNRIVICGDYDADGVSSSAIMCETLRALSAKVEVWIPSRFGQGYGLSREIVQELKDQGFSLIITVDNGIRAKAEAEFAQSLGMDIIITDHHAGPPTREEEPQCLLIDPILEHENYPFKYLCGAGVAYKFASALIASSTLSQEEKENLKNKIIDLAAIGTIADCVTLLGENRLLASRGLAAINRRPRLGIRELAKVAGISGELDAWNVSWQITPRLNVAGRLDHANTAYQLLMTKDGDEARSIAGELNQRNIERQTMTKTIVEEACLEIEANQLNEKLLIAISPNVLDEGKVGWNEGVIGLAAGRLAEKYSRPCFVITRSEGVIKGSGRSVEQFNLVDALEAGKEQLSRYGGHKMACGFTLKSLADLDDFVLKVKAQAEQDLKGVDLSPILMIDAEIEISQINDELIEAVNLFKPFGQDNPEPKFMSRSALDEIIIMGKDKTHIKFRFGRCWALAFGRAEELSHLKTGDIIDFVYTVGFNEFNGRREAQLKIVDLKIV
jgi:single-stranded-DNA-specific exonuclease